MSIIIIIILSIVQGLAEFLPISSSGHLVLCYKLFGINESTIFLSLVLHFGTLLSVLFVYRKRIIELIKRPFQKTTYLLLISTFATCIVVLIVKKSVENSFGGEYLYVGFIVTAIVLMIAEFSDVIFRNGRRVTKTGNIETISSISYVQAGIIGLAQGVASFPAISRSGTTIATGLMIGVKKEVVADYSFLLSIPIILISSIYEIGEFVITKQTIIFNVWELILGLGISFIVGLACIKLMLSFVKKQRLYVFAYYLLILSLFLILNDNLFFWF